MTDPRTNENEGADPSSDIENQNRSGGTGEDRAGAGEGDDTDDGGASDTKAQDLARAGRDDFDPNDGQE